MGRCESQEAQPDFFGGQFQSLSWADPLLARESHNFFGCCDCGPRNRRFLTLHVVLDVRCGDGEHRADCIISFSAKKVTSSRNTYHNPVQFRSFLHHVVLWRCLFKLAANP